MKLELMDNAELESQLAAGKEAETPEYTGPNRRVARRRILADRRAMVRFELDKPDRRQLKDRRAAKSVWDDRPLI